MKGHVPQPDRTEVLSIHGNRVTGIEGQHAGPDDAVTLQGHVCDPERALAVLVIKGNQVMGVPPGTNLVP